MPQEKHTPFPAPYVSFPITLFGHRKFIALTQHPWKGSPEFVFRLLAHAAAHFPDGDFSPIAPTSEKGEEVGGKRAVWNTIFRVSYGNRAFDKKNPGQTDWGWQIALHFRACGWFDEQWVLDPELFQNWNQKLARDSGQRSAQARFNAMKRHHPEQLDSLAEAFFSDFGRWPVGYTPPPPGEPPEGGEAAGQRPPLEPDTGPPPGESETRPSGATEGRAIGRRTPLSKGALRGANTGQKPVAVNHGNPAKESPSKRLWAAGKALTLVPKGSARAKALEKVIAEASAEMTGVSLDLPKPAAPAPAPAKPKAAPADSAPMTALDVAKLFLETPDILSAGHVKELRRAGIALPPEVSARFPISPTLPALSPKSRTALSADKRAGATLSNPAAKARQGTFLRSKAFQPVAASAGQLKLPIRPTRKPAKQLATA